MQRSPGMLQDFPVELLTEICLCSDLPTLANVRLVSKACKGLIESDAVARDICIRLGVLLNETETLADLRKPTRPLDADWPALQNDAQVSSWLKRQGYTNDEQSSYWRLLQATFDRRRGRPFCRKGSQPAPTIRREYDTDSVRQMRIDHIDRVLIHTSQGGGLGVTCIDTGKLLWSDKQVPVYSNFLEYSEGWVITSVCRGYHDGFQIWYFDRLSTETQGPPQRGKLRVYQQLKTPAPVRRIRFHYPYFVAVTTDFHVICMDVRSKELISDFDVKQAKEACGPPYEALVRDVDFDDAYFYTLISAWYGDELQRSYGPPDADEWYPWLLQAWSRRTGQKVWQVDTCGLNRDRSLIEHQYEFDQKDDQRDDCEWQRPVSRKRKSGYVSGMPFAMRIEETTRSLCLTFGKGLIIWPVPKDTDEHLTSMEEVDDTWSVDGNAEGGQEDDQDPPIYLSIAQPEVELEKGERHPEADQLSVGGGLACFDIHDAIVLVDLQAVLSGRPDDALVRLIRPEIDPWTRPFCFDDCSMHVDQKILAFYSWAPPKEGTEERKAWDRGKSTNITLYDFAEIGRSRVEAKEPQTETRVLKLSAEDNSEDIGGIVDEDSLDNPSEASSGASSQVFSEEAANEEAAVVPLEGNAEASS